MTTCMIKQRALQLRDSGGTLSILSCLSSASITHGDLLARPRPPTQTRTKVDKDFGSEKKG
jgi:hypothetical protein